MSQISMRSKFKKPTEFRCVVNLWGGGRLEGVKMISNDRRIEILTMIFSRCDISLNLKKMR